MPKIPNLPEKDGLPCLATAIPVPLEQLTDSEQLDGSAGSNRAPSHITQQIAAQNDLQAIQTWLAEFEVSPQTHRTYRKEAERLLLWSLIKKRKPLSSLMRDDLREYQYFLEQQQPFLSGFSSQTRLQIEEYVSPLSPVSSRKMFKHHKLLVYFLL